jgi:RNA polymerase sigma-70 factor, ECF subfamily
MSVQNLQLRHAPSRLRFCLRYLLISSVYPRLKIESVSLEFMAITPTSNLTKARGEFEDLIKQIRPELHRYVARMVGSAIDGEDVVQEAVLKAFYSLDQIKNGINLRGWLFRIAHNKAIDYLRGRNLQTMEQLDENIIADPEDSPLEQKELTAAALKVFLKLAPRQRSSVILKDVLGYSLAEISELLDATVPEIKAVLHRGRSRLRELGKSVETAAPVLDKREFKLLTRYIDLFNARDFEAVRQMLTDETRLELVNKASLRGASEISRNYFHNYQKLDDWHFRLGTVENRPAILVFDRPQTESASRPAYFLLLTTKDGQISAIRDYRYARYVTEDAEITVI